MSSTTVQDQPKSLVAVLRRRAYYSYGREGASRNQSSSPARRDGEFIQTSDKIRFLAIAIVAHSIKRMPSSMIRYGRLRRGAHREDAAREFPITRPPLAVLVESLELSADRAAPCESFLLHSS
jgi:hypothetical protein